MKALQEMNLVDDFLVNSLTSHKVYGEAASRYILECIMGRKIGRLAVVPQRFLCGENGEDHGIRLDVYLDEEAGGIFDVEPDRNGSRQEKETLPRRVRFYHAKIDSGSLAAGEDYGKLRNVAVIFITTYDPFERGRMLYTVRNGCVEEPDIPYDDGAETLFLYTRGEKGNPPEKLRELLRYMEHSMEYLFHGRKCTDQGAQGAASDGDRSKAGRRGRVCVYEELRERTENPGRRA